MKSILKVFPIARVCLLALSTAVPVSSLAAKSSGHLLVANKGEHTLGIIDVASGQQIATIDEEGVTGHELAASPDGRTAYVPIYGNSGVGRPGTDGDVLRLIDLNARKITASVSFGKGVRPHCAMIGPKDHLLYVTTELDKSVTVIDPSSAKILYSIPTGQEESHMLILSSDGKRGYTANVGPGTVSVLDLPHKKTLKVIPICEVTQRIAISPDDRWVFTADQKKPRLAVIDTRKDEVTAWIDLPGVAYGTAPTPDGKWLIAALPKEGKVAFIDIKNRTVKGTVDVPKAPQEVLVRPDGKEAYVSCDASQKVSVIDIGHKSVSKTIGAGKGVDGLAWANQ